MNKTSLLLLAVCGLPAAGQAEEDSRHHVGVGMPVWINAKARFSAARATDPGPNDGSPTRNRFYNDGFNRVDSTGNAAPPGGVPLTSAFGYANRDVQVVQATAVPLTPGSLALHSAQINGGDYTRSRDNAASPGLEIFYRYDVKKEKSWSFSLEGGASYQFFQWRQDGAVNATGDLITDNYSLGGVFLPAASYSGPVVWTPGDKVIGSTPTRTLGPSTPAVVTGQRSLKLDTLHFRFGPAAEWRASERSELGAQTGVLLGVGFSRLNFNDTVAVASPTMPVFNESGSSSHTHVWFGWFNALRVTLHLDKDWDAHLEVRHVLQENLTHNGGLRSANLNLSDALGFVGALSYRF